MSFVLAFLLHGCADEESGKDSFASVPDGDGDGFFGDDDCDDADPTVHAGADEHCDGADDDCDGEVDEDPLDGSVFYADADGDGYGDGDPVIACEATTGLAAVDGDCDDADPAYHPGATEDDCADPADYNCDGSVGGDDGDGDGYAACDDCDDDNAAVHPGAAEACDGVDTDCDGVIDPDDAEGAATWYLDGDGDGWGNEDSQTTACAQPDGWVDQGADCDDADPAYHPGATEDDCLDPADYNCDGSVGYADADADGAAACEDCDDDDAASHPGAPEVCDGADNDCDGVTDPDSAEDAPDWYADADGDGHGEAEAAVQACEAPDGYVADGDDCDDTSADAHPGGTESCDGLDNDCDGAVDDGTASTTLFYADADADGYGDPAAVLAACAAPAGYVDDASDCDDGDAGVHPGATESCDGEDEDCDGEADEAGSGDAWYADVDGDGFGDPASTTLACSEPVGFTADAGDCDDLDADVNPDALEHCDGVDEDCDGAADDGPVDAPSWYPDGDGDGWGDDGGPVSACEAPDGHVESAGDCDDADPAYHPGAAEADCADPADYNCDGSSGYADADGDGWAACEECDDAEAAVNPDATELCDEADTDEDCDGLADDEDAGAVGGSSWYTDADADGHGAGLPRYACDAEADQVAVDGDCDDGDAGVNPDAPEVCDEAATDEDCDGLADDADPDLAAASTTTWYADGDRDGYGDPDSSLAACAQPASYVDNGEDCNDASASIHPDAAEVCGSDDADDDCDGLVDDADPDAGGRSTFYRDADSDGYGGASTVSACERPDGFWPTGGDCDDGEAAINPAATEVCDAADTDEDCDGLADDDDPGATGESTGWLDADGDGFGGESSLTACDLPEGWIADDSDCDDGDAAVNPDAAEVCDGVDNDCDGDADGDAGDRKTWYADLDGDGWGDDASTLEDCSPPVGWVAVGGDCDDHSPTVNPGADEVCGGADEDCDGDTDEDSAVDAPTWYTDVDGDGYGVAPSTVACDQPAGFAALAGDCDDGDAAYNPAAVEDDCADPADYNCDGSTGYADADGDGWAACEDCDDDDAGVNPDAVERCDDAEVDEDCDGLADDADTTATGRVTAFADSDADGYGGATSARWCDLPEGWVTVAGDCDDAAHAVNPAAPEVCDGSDVDEDCDGASDDADSSASSASKTTVYADTDGDGYGDPARSTAVCDPAAGWVADDQDCDDDAAAINPAAAEVCDGADVDEDCDGLSDDEDPGASGGSSWYADGDGDGWGGGTSTLYCDAPEGWVATGGDCDDAAATVHPAALERCDAADVDEDCDGLSDDADPSASPTSKSTVHADADADGYGDPSTATSRCDPEAGWVSDARDCDDGDAAVNPAAPEVCDAADVDEDCDGLSDDDDVSVSGRSNWYADGDGDGWGGSSWTPFCDAPEGWAEASGDCDDGDPAVNPDAAELCDDADVDEDCDGLADDLDPDAGGTSTWYGDGDGDGWGAGLGASRCEAGADEVATDGDCDDADPAIHPEASETCDGVDDDCDTLVDDDDPGLADAATWYYDGDEDGWGDPLLPELACEAPVGHVAAGSDCDDGDAAVHPEAAEVCDAADTDEDCDELSDDADPSVSGRLDYHADADADGYGAAAATPTCDPAEGWILDGQDCDDGDGAINPGASEVCDSVDNDCDTLIDDADPGVEGGDWYEDLDEDGYGGAFSASQCSAPVGTVDNADDCDDADPAISPDASEVCEDGVDNDCSGFDSCRDYGLLADSAADLGWVGASLGSASAPGFMGGTLAAGWYDVSGDAVADLVLGDYLHDTVTSNDNKGRAYVIRGASGGPTDTVASPYATVTGAASGDRLAGGLSFVGDIDGDGVDELAVGAYLANASGTDSGAAWLFKGPVSGSLTPSSAWITVSGTDAALYAGHALADGGDLTGDGTNDWVIGAYEPAGSGSKTGRVAVVSGALASGSYALTTSASLVRITGVVGSSLGATLLGDVDVDGDGLDELYVGSANTEAAYVFEAPMALTYTEADAESSLSGVSLYTDASKNVSCTRCMVSAGDSDGDGYEDLLFGLDGYDAGGASTDNYGGAFLVPGGLAGISGDIPSQASASVIGYAASDYAGRGVGAGDFDGDGEMDLLVGAPGFDLPVSGGGVLALLYGPVSGSYNLSASLSDTDIAVYLGSVSAAGLGTTTAAAGDLDDDGYEDFVAGAPGWAASTTRYGKIFGWYGSAE